MAAIDEVLRDRGYSVVSTASTTEEDGEVVARGPRVVTYPRQLVVKARRTSTACVVSMRKMDPFGDKDQVEQMMRALLAKLGV
jgi:hypothetical protein